MFEGEGNSFVRGEFNGLKKKVKSPFTFQILENNKQNQTRIAHFG